LPGYFFDTSALAKLYHAEVGTPKVDEIVEAAGTQVLISRLTVVELRSVFAIKVRTQFISREDARLAAPISGGHRDAEVRCFRGGRIGIRAS
jgi:hypothetical protein